MVSEASITVVQANLIGSEYLVTDTGEYQTIISRVLSVYDSNGNIIGTPYNMGSALTQLVPVTADAFLTFVLVVTDNTGVWTATAIIVADGYYVAQFLARLAALGCGCSDNDIDNLMKGEIYLVGAQRYALGNLGPASNAAIINANIYVNNTF